MKNNYSWLTGCLVLLAVLVITSCQGGLPLLPGSDAGKNRGEGEIPLNRHDTLTQVSILNALLEGVYDGVIDVATLKKNGDFGLGTFDALNGEMLAVDREYCRIKADGTAEKAGDDQKIPFAAVTFFETDLKASLPAGTDEKSLQTVLGKLLPSQNLFYAVRLDGDFSQIKARSVPPQSKPYPRLVEVAANQPVFEYKDERGTMVGFYCPSYVAGLNVPGYHLHFLTADKKKGGHVLSFVIKQGEARLDITSEFYMILPEADSNFTKLDLSEQEAKKGELEKVEK